VSVNSFGRVFRFTTWGESHGPAIGAVVGCPPGLARSPRGSGVMEKSRLAQYAASGSATVLGMV